jgi:hypothetical protein
MELYDGDEREYKMLPADEEERMFKAWEAMVISLKDKNYNLALQPVIESHLNTPLVPKSARTEENKKKLHRTHTEFYRTCAKILRKHDPKRILSIKGHGPCSLGASSRSTPFEYLNPDEIDSSPYRIMAGSGGGSTGREIYPLWLDWNRNETYSNDEILRKTEELIFPQELFDYCKKYDVTFWVEHWKADFAYDIGGRDEQLAEQAAEAQHPKYIRRSKMMQDRWPLETRIKFAETIADLIRKHGVAGAGLKEYGVVVWDFDTNEPLKAEPGSDLYKVQQAYKNIFSK